jgi:hypothetical protein
MADNLLTPCLVTQAMAMEDTAAMEVLREREREKETSDPVIPCTGPV